MNQKFFAPFATSFFLLIGLLATSFAQAQYNDGQPGRDKSLVLKVYPLFFGPMPRLALAGSVEFKVAESGTLQLDGQFGLPYTMDNYNVQYNYFGGQYRYYFNGFEAFDGFYGGAQVGIGTATFTEDISKTNGRHFAIPVGIVVGYQFKITKKLYLDLFLGPQVAVNGKFETTNPTSNFFNFKSYDGLSLRSGLGLCYGF